MILVHQENINNYLGDSITKKNSFLYFELRDPRSITTLASNFLFLDKLKDSENIIDPNLQVCIHIKYKHIMFVLLLYQIFF